MLQFQVNYYLGNSCDKKVHCSYLEFSTRQFQSTWAC